MTITAKIIEDSIGAFSPRLTTFELKYPRFIHSEFMTHRHFSRSSSSSRAIPVERQIEMIKEDTAMPIHWGKNQKGMQAFEEISELVCFGEGDFKQELSPKEAWNVARDSAIIVAEGFVKAGYHKQIVNRILEPFSHITVVMTTTQIANFFALRSHKDAQPEIKMLSDLMQEAYNASTPTLLEAGAWHLPYITKEERENLVLVADTDYGERVISMDDLVKASTARSARVSYLTHDGGKPTLEADKRLYDRLVGSVPLHASPAEHQAKVDDFTLGDGINVIWDNPSKSGNFDAGWVQNRKLLDGEFVAQ